MYTTHILLLGLIAFSVGCIIQTNLCDTNSDCSPYQVCLTLNSTCVGGPYVGDNCTTTDECLFGYCVVGGLCANIPTSGPCPCNQQSDCREGNCTISVGYGRCGLTGKSCKLDKDCLPCDVCSLGVCM